ncbi:hypothetical protein HRG_003258 [Hirsutella rhossiliensis]|uniref:Cell division cycle protein cdt2 n=1 Tax=Hirsutella rhossiliensis TaxID=111463 RepID=A0A9P8N261_9HYPO|nr:uncharacterized protein HRG_03258 [Hirsutella rhossiliensis]KAH0965242.1 hypothetical protein HRG_03258 [Hirsutella rhossiliensis]
MLSFTRQGHDRVVRDRIIGLAQPAPASSAHFSAPCRASSSQRKEKRVPSVTPRRFRRFFAPRSFQPQATRLTLGILSSAAVNRQMVSPQSLAGDSLSSDPICPSSPTDRLGRAYDDDQHGAKDEMQLEPPAKRRRGMPLDDMPRLLTRPYTGLGNTDLLGDGTNGRATLSERRRANLGQFFKASRRGVQNLSEKSISTQQIAPADIDSPLPLRNYQPQPVRKFRNRGLAAHLLDREHGFSSHPGKDYLAYPTSDAYHCTPLDQSGTSIPFSLASCHGASVTAIGDEQGNVRFLSTAKLSAPGNKVTSIVKVHDNAIMDLDFSHDDSRLASACGDRSGRVLDTQTQTVAVELGGGHWDSLRQVTFQPGEGNGNVLATSDRASRVQIWDLRCSPLPAQCFSAGSTGGGTGRGGGRLRDQRLDVAPARTVNTIDNAHERTVQGSTSSASVTALQWLPAGREHLLLTASEANASIKLWDTRYMKPRRHTAETPLAVTPEPVTHTWRSYGITSMALGTDAARLYAVCKDSTVYAYSTNHLVLGHAPELLDGAAKRRPAAARGLGPLYGLRHDSFRVASFYVKCAVRPAAHGGGGAELLAVGSSDACAVLFPTDERYMRAAWARREHMLPPSGGGMGGQTVSSPFLPSPLTPPGSTPSWLSSSSSSPLPILRAGTPLIRGHAREVTTLSWSRDGKLVTASDDYHVRHWQQGGPRARHLRQVGEFGGERHQAGWADVGDDWDCEEG